jgi:hypothetical protein
MEIKKLIRNEQEYIEYFEYLLGWIDGTNKLWKTEDLPKLQPYFEYSKLLAQDLNHKDLEFPAESAQFYGECCQNYCQEHREYRDAFRNINEYVLADAMGFTENVPDDDDQPIVYSLGESFRKFPVIIAGHVDSGFDRSGDYSACLLTLIYEEDFLDDPDNRNTL